MSKFEINDIDNCFVCGEYMGPFKNELTVATGYSEKTVLQIIENFLESSISEVIIEKGGICQNCFIKFNEYDEHQTIANQILSELNSMLLIRESYVAPKQEQKRQFEIICNEPEQAVIQLPGEYDLNPVLEDDIMPEDIKPILYDEILDIKPVIERKRSNYVKKDKDIGLVVTIINNQKFYTCEFCQKNFQSRSRLRTHRQTHSTERNFMCQECGSKFKTLNCLKNHSRLHSNVYFHCDLCNNRFKGKHELRCHMEAIHLGKKEHICQICGKAFSRDKTLRQHLLYHYNVRNIVCEICGFKTINRPKMTRHLKSHSGVRNYACNICGKRFLYSYNVTAHIKHVHYHEKRPTTSEDKLLCTICGKKFQKIWKVKEHMKEFHKIIEETIEIVGDKNIEIITDQQD
ncbi:hypothetical protein ACKWTF_014029 [Chironomus riparius]